MHVTDRGLLAIIRHEGIVPGPYLDIKNIWTFGIGHTAAAGPPDPAKMKRGTPDDIEAGIEEAFRVFRADLARFEADVRRAVTVPLAAHEFDALVSFHYNTGGIARATLTKHVNAGEFDAAGKAFLNWRRPPAIVPRREAERDLFLHGTYPTSAIPVWSVDARGRVDFARPLRRLTEDEALALMRPPYSRDASVPTPPVRSRQDQDASVPKLPERTRAGRHRSGTGWLARLQTLISFLFRKD